MWQDAVFTLGGFVLAAGLVPALRAPVAPPRGTSLTMVAVLGAYTAAFLTLGLYSSAASLGLQVALWGALLWKGR